MTDACPDSGQRERTEAPATRQPLTRASGVAERAGWHGLPPTTHTFEPPLQLEAPLHGVTESVSPAPALWVDLEYANGARQTVRGFAMAWTSSAVLAQWVEFSIAREAWVRPDQCTRRELAGRPDNRARTGAQPDDRPDAS